MAKKGPRPKSVKIPIKMLGALVNPLVEAYFSGALKQDGELAKAIEEILLLVPFTPGGDTFSFPYLFTEEEDYKAVVKWLKKDGLYIDDDFNWVAPVNSFSWMLKHIFDQGYTKRFPSAGARKHIALKDFHRKINITDIKRVSVDGPGPGIKTNPRKR